MPVIKTGHRWDFVHIKNLCGQGRLYVKLNVPKAELLKRGNSDDELSKPVFHCTESDPAVEENASSSEIDLNCGSPVSMDMEDMKYLDLLQNHLV